MPILAIQLEKAKLNNPNSNNPNIYDLTNNQKLMLKT